MASGGGGLAGSWPSAWQVAAARESTQGRRSLTGARAFCRRQHRPGSQPPTTGGCRRSESKRPLTTLTASGLLFVYLCVPSAVDLCERPKCYTPPPQPPAPPPPAGRACLRRPLARSLLARTGQQATRLQRETGMECRNSLRYPRWLGCTGDWEWELDWGNGQ